MLQHKACRFYLRFADWHLPGNDLDIHLPHVEGLDGLLPDVDVDDDTSSRQHPGNHFPRRIPLDDPGSRRRIDHHLWCHDLL